jgi:hypothetical protein
MLLFFAVSGIWQTLLGKYQFSKPLALLSSLHTGHGSKSGENLNSTAMIIFVLAMAVAFIVTTILGVVMAFKLGRSRRAAFYCLAAGVALPLVLVCLRLIK